MDVILKLSGFLDSCVRVFITLLSLVLYIDSSPVLSLISKQIPYNSDNNHTTNLLVSGTPSRLGTRISVGSVETSCKTNLAV
jgi:hypothetical protein